MNKLDWEKLSSKYLVKENWATLRVDTCRMPDGTIIPDYYVLEYPDWVNAVALTSDKQVILVKQYRHAAGEVILELPGGCIESDCNISFQMKHIQKFIVYICITILFTWHY